MATAPTTAKKPAAKKPAAKAVVAKKPVAAKPAPAKKPAAPKPAAKPVAAKKPVASVKVPVKVAEPVKVPAAKKQSVAKAAVTKALTVFQKLLVATREMGPKRTASVTSYVTPIVRDKLKSLAAAEKTTLDIYVATVLTRHSADA
jgi:hypothetical protein